MQVCGLRTLGGAAHRLSRSGVFGSIRFEFAKVELSFEEEESRRVLSLRVLVF